MLTKIEVEKAVPANLKTSITQQFVDQINSIVSDPIVAEQVRENFISYSTVLRDGKYKTEDYLNAVVYVSFKLMNLSNKDAYFRTFPQRYASLMAKNASEKDIASYVSMYHKNKLVNAILQQAMVPTWVLNQDLFQAALNTQAELMRSANSEMVRTTAANSILSALAKPKETGPSINFNAVETSGMNELKGMLTQLAQQQADAIANGQTLKDIAAQKIIEHKED
jgi:hypothetical protein